MIKFLNILEENSKRSKRKTSVLTCIIIVPTQYDYSHIFAQTGLLHLTMKFSFHLMNWH